MGARERRLRNRQTDNPWTAEDEDNGKTPLIVGLVIAGLIVIGVAVWQFSSGTLNAFTLSTEAQEESTEQTAEDTVSSGLVYVHVVGAVNNPGVYSISPNARVYDAIAAAGGAADNAAVEALNLARTITDGEQIRVPTVEETQQAADTSDVSGQSSSTMIVNGKVNINTADSATLQTLSGVGASTAEKIIADRESNGAFSTIEDLKRVSGIGDKKFAAIADSICVG